YAWAKQIRRSPRGEVSSAAAPAFARLVPEAGPAAATPEGAFVAQVGGASIRIEAGFVAVLVRGVVAVLGSDSRWLFTDFRSITSSKRATWTYHHAEGEAGRA